MDFGGYTFNVNWADLGALVSEGSQAIRNNFHLRAGLTGMNIEECDANSGPQPENFYLQI